MVRVAVKLVLLSKKYVGAFRPLGALMRVCGPPLGLLLGLMKIPTLPETVVAAPVEARVSVAPAFQSKVRLALAARINAAVEVLRAVPSARLKLAVAATVSGALAERLLAPPQRRVPALTVVAPV